MHTKLFSAMHVLHILWYHNSLRNVRNVSVQHIAEYQSIYTRDAVNKSDIRAFLELKVIVNVSETSQYTRSFRGFDFSIFTVPTSATDSVLRQFSAQFVCNVHKTGS